MPKLTLAEKMKEAGIEPTYQMVGDRVQKIQLRQTKKYCKWTETEIQKLKSYLNQKPLFKIASKIGEREIVVFCILFKSKTYNQIYYKIAELNRQKHRTEK